jgi:hypothetical protein
MLIRTLTVARRLLVLVAAGTVAACGSSTPTSPVTLSGCTGAVTVTVTDGLTPTFSWTPACLAHFIDIQPTDPLPPGTVAGSPVWFVLAKGGAGNTLLPGLHYGQVPAEGDNATPATPLSKGQRYIVRVWRSVPASDAVIAGQATFTPQ